MNYRFNMIDSGTVTTPRGFVSGAVEAGIKSQGRKDLGVLYSERLCAAAGVFTTNEVKAAPVVLSQRHLRNRQAQAVVVNSGCANACTGDDGMSDAVEMAGVVASVVGVAVDDVLVASTGVVGIRLPMERIRDGIGKMTLTKDGGHDLARAMMTTDTFAKEIAVLVETEAGNFSIGGVAKGAGMIHPNMATMLCFIATDAAVDGAFLESALRKAVMTSFNMITVDGDTSPSDMVVLLANGMAGSKLMNETNGTVFQKALDELCVYLAKSIVRDGEGATKLIEVEVEGTINESDARLAARTVAGSSLVKAAIHGNDPNWGRIVVALGRSGVRMSERNIDCYLNGVCVMRQGALVPFDKSKLAEDLDRKEVLIKLNLNLGKYKATAWGCDLSEEYVTINSAYTT